MLNKFKRLIAALAIAALPLSGCVTEPRRAKVAAPPAPTLTLTWNWNTNWQTNGWFALVWQSDSLQPGKWFAIGCPATNGLTVPATNRTGFYRVGLTNKILHCAA